MDPSDDAFERVVARWRTDPWFATALAADRERALEPYELDATDRARLARLLDRSVSYRDLFGASAESEPSAINPDG